jgi:hypothetical protein
MHIRYTESFPPEAPDAAAAWRLIRKIVDDRLAEEILKRLPKEKHSDIA